MYKFKVPKVLLITGLSLLIGCKLQAKQVHFGFSTSLIVSNARIANKIDIYRDYRVFYPLYGFNLEGFAEYKLSNRWRIQSGLGYLKKGGIVRFGVNHYTNIIDMKLDYLQMPLLANYYITDRFFVSMGFELAYLISSENKLPYPGTGLVQFRDNAFEISGLAGVNYWISKKLGVGIRYNHGITKISVMQWTDGYGPVIGQSNVYNQYFQLLFKIKID